MGGYDKQDHFSTDGINSISHYYELKYKVPANVAGTLLS
jgi:hypothetical protein